ncbi:MAG: MFS transporter [Stellaceae bacterium]|jgi:MFS family permease
MLALIATLAIQALATLTVLAPPVFVGLAAPEIGVGSNAIGVFTAVVYAAACLSAALAGGPVKRRGAIRVSQAGLVIGGAGIACVATASLPIVLLGAALIGVGYGPMTPASSHILIRQTPPERRALIFSIKQTGVPLGGALAGLVVPALTLAFGWRGAALAVAAASVVLAVACEPLHHSLDDDADPSAAGERGMFSSLRLVLGLPGLRKLSLSSLAYSAMQLCISAFIVTFLTVGLGMDLVTAGLIMAAAQAAGVGGRILWGWLSDRLMTARMALSLLGYAIGLSGAALALATPAWPVAAVALSAMALGAVALGWNGVFLAEVARQAPPGLAGSATGGALAFTFLGALLGPPLFGAVVDLTGSYRAAFLAASLCAALAGFVVMRRPAD